MVAYATVFADANTPIEDNRRIFGWNGTSGDRTHWTQASWHQTTTGTHEFIPGAGGPLKYYGIFLFRAWISTADEWDVYLHIFNGDNSLAQTLLMDSYRGNYRSQEIRYLFQLQKDQYAKIQHRVKAGSVKKADIGYSVYVNNRYVGEDQPPIPTDPTYEQRTKTLTATLVRDGVDFLYNERKFNYLVVIDNTNRQIIDPAYKGNHINLWDYFFWKNGRRPNAGEDITFVIPEDRVFVAPMGFTRGLATENGPQYQNNQFIKKFVYSRENTFAGHAAVSLKGWNAALNNKITVEVKGKALGSMALYQTSGGLGTTSPLFTLFDKANPTQPINYMSLYNTGLFSDPMAHLRTLKKIARNGTTIENYTNDTGWGAYITISDPVKNPAFYTDVPATLRVISGGYVLGGGGDAGFQMFTKDRIWYNGYNNPYKQENTSDRTNIHGGDAIWVGGANTVLQIENYGYISGGGGGGACIGSFNEGILNNNWTYADGGGGAPFGGVAITWKFPLYVDLVKLSQVPLSPIPTGWIDWDFDFEIDENGGIAQYNHLVYMYKADVENVVDWGRIGYDQYEDVLMDVSLFNASASSGALISPVAGYQSKVDGSNGMNLISGGGGGPGQNGQIGTIVNNGGSGGRLNELGNFAGTKGSAVVYKGFGNSVILNNYPGSVYNL